MTRSLLFWIALCAALCWAALAVAQEEGWEDHHWHPPEDAPIHHKFYSTWMRPDEPTASCCNLVDCYPAEFKREGGTWFAKRREDEEWIAIPPAKFELNRDSPDGRNHVCMQPPGSTNLVFCAVTGGGT